MKATFISKEANDAKFSMEFPWEEFNEAIVRAYRETKDRYVIDGFRRGKAPRSLIEKHYGEGIFYEDAINNMFSDNYPKALKELDINPISSPRAEFSQIKKGEDLTITISVETYPEFEVSGYKGVEVAKEVRPVTDEDVDRELKSLQLRNARLVSVDRAAKEGDTLLLDYKGFTGDKQFEGGTAENYSLKLGSGTFIPGFEEQLIGVKAGESKDVKLTFPEEYHSAELAGAEAVFKCTVHEVKEQQLDEINDDFATDVSEFDTLDELKADTRKKLEQQAEEFADAQMRNDALESVYNANDIPVPDSLVEDEIDRSVRDFEQQLAYQGLSLQSYLDFSKSDMAAFRSNIREDAKRRVKMRMIMEKIAEQEKFEASAEEIDEKFAEMGKQYGMSAEDVKAAMGSGAEEMIAEDIKADKASKLIFDSMKSAAKKSAKKSGAKDDKADKDEAAEKKNENAEKKKSAAKKESEGSEKKEAKKSGGAKKTSKKTAEKED